MKNILRRVPRVLLVGCILLVVLVASALAYLSVSTGSLTNTFTPAQPADPDINETFAGNVKTGVKVNVGNPGYAVYVRAAIVVNWEDASGNILATAPVLDTDYTLDLNTTNWFEHGGFYYHEAMVLNERFTEVLINECRLKDDVIAPNDYHLSVKIVAQTIQALGTTDDGDIPAVTNAWGVLVKDGILQAPTS